MTRHLLTLILLMASVSTCKTAEQESRATSAAPASSATTASAQATLDSMDTRAPVPLLPMMANHQKVNMRDHLSAVQAIIAGAAANDFVAIEKAAGRIGYSEQMGAMCTHMGAGAPGFTEAALKFHRTADTIGDAAKQQDLSAVLTALGRTLATCTSCHAGFKQQVVDDATFSSLTRMAPPSGSAHHQP